MCRMSLPFNPKRVRAYDFEFGAGAEIVLAATFALMMARIYSFMIPKLQQKSSSSSQA
jgi:hypothetical protein